MIRLQAEPEAVASILFSLGDGFGIQVLSDPDWDQQAAFELGVASARRLLGEAPAEPVLHRRGDGLRSDRRLWSPGTWTTSRFAPGGGIPKRSRSPCTTSTGTFTASSSARRSGAGGLPLRAGGWSGKARQSTAAAAPVLGRCGTPRGRRGAAARDERQCPRARPPPSCSTHGDPGGVEVVRRSGERRPATR